MTGADSKPYLTVTDVARLLMVSAPTIRLWTEKGFLQTELTFGGHRRYLRADVERVMQERGLGSLGGATRAQIAPPLSVLIIDDEEDVAQTLLQGIKAAWPDSRVAVACDGFVGGLLAVQQQPDIILLDLRMPGMHGIEVCKVLKSNPATRHIYIIITTGAANGEEAQTALAAGAQDCLYKPIRMQQLRQAIEHAQLALSP